MSSNQFINNKLGEQTFGSESSDMTVPQRASFARKHHPFK
jgi:hypothetical protein